MKEFIAACVQIASRPMDISHNMDKIAAYIKRAVKEYDAKLVVLPESVTTGFTPDIPPEEFYGFLSPIPGPETDEICALAKDLGVHVVFPTYERGEEVGIVYNSSVLIDDEGNILGVYRKTHPFPTERLEGGGWTTPGDKVVVVNTGLASIGMIICYDGDFPELARCNALNGAEVITRPSAFLRSFELWDLTNRGRAYDNHVYMLAVNAVGRDAKDNYYFGGSMIVDPIANKLGQARGGEEIIAAKLNPDPIKYVTYGSKSPMIFDHIEDRNINVYKDILKEGKSVFEPYKRIPYKR